MVSFLLLFSCYQMVWGLLLCQFLCSPDGVEYFIQRVCIIIKDDQCFTQHPVIFIPFLQVGLFLLPHYYMVLSIYRLFVIIFATTFTIDLIITLFVLEGVLHFFTGPWPSCPLEMSCVERMYVISFYCHYMS